MRMGKISPSDATFTAAPLTDHTSSGVKLQLRAHRPMSFGDVCFINGHLTGGEAQIAQGDVIANANTIVMCVSTYLGTGDIGDFLMIGTARNDSWSWVGGGLIYLSTVGTTGNTLTQTAPTGTDNVIQVLGVALDSNIIVFNPSLAQVEHT